MCLEIALSRRRRAGGGPQKSNLMNERTMTSEPSAQGASVTLAPGVRRIRAGNAGMMTGAGTNTYLLGDREVAVLDPGPDDATHLRNILAAAGPQIRWVVVTHTHRDHSPLAAELARMTGARLIGLPPPGGRPAGRGLSAAAPAARRRGSRARRCRAHRHPYPGPRLELRVLLGFPGAAAVHRRSRARRRVAGHLAARR